MQSEDISYKFNLRSSSDYDTYAAGNEDLIEAYFYNHLLRTDSSARYHDFKITRGKNTCSMFLVTTDFNAFWCLRKGEYF